MFTVSWTLYERKYLIWGRAGSYGRRYVDRLEGMYNCDDQWISAFFHMCPGSADLQKSEGEKPYTFSSVFSRWIGGVLCCGERNIERQEDI